MRKRERNYLKLKKQMQRRGTDHRIYIVWCIRYKDIFDNLEKPKTKRNIKKKKKYVLRHL